MDKETIQDLDWWLTHIGPWDGWAFMNVSEWTSPADVAIATDASKTGQGGVNETTQKWFGALWSQRELDQAWIAKAISMPQLELHALVSAARLWGTEWRGLRVQFNCDCEPAVHCVNRGYSNSPPMCGLLRELCTLAHTHGFVFRAVHIAGATNTYPDLLSRDRVQGFLESSRWPIASRTLLLGQRTRS
jgi:hypothetical protein